MTDTLKEHLRKIGSKGGLSKTALQIETRKANFAKAREARWKNKSEISKITVDTEHAH